MRRLLRKVQAVCSVTVGALLAIMLPTIPSAQAHFLQIQPSDEDGVPTFEFATNDALFVTFRADIHGVRIALCRRTGPFEEARVAAKFRADLAGHVFEPTVRPCVERMGDCVADEQVLLVAKLTSRGEGTVEAAASV